MGWGGEWSLREEKINNQIDCFIFIVCGRMYELFFKQ